MPSLRDVMVRRCIVLPLGFRTLNDGGVAIPDSYTVGSLSLAPGEFWGEAPVGGAVMRCGVMTCL
jgi:hypothetical protein